MVWSSMLNHLKNKKMCRRLTKDDIECRVAQTGKSGEQVWASFLLYKDARVDQRILDETYGAMNWKRSHELIGDRLYCTVSVWDAEKHEWISKQDVGTESNTEKEKGQASDAFKRACFNWGIGRELYTAPKIFVTLGKKEYSEKDGKIYPKLHLNVSDIDYDELGNISRLTLIDDKNVQRFVLRDSRTVQDKKKSDEVESKPVIEVGDDAFQKWVEWMAKHWGAADFERGQAVMMQKFTVSDEVLKKMHERAEFLADL